ncbi:transposase [Bacillus cereus]
MIHNYTSNISREQFELICEDLENASEKMCPRTVDSYEVFCGVLYLLKTGCQWRNLRVIFHIGKRCMSTIKFGRK